MLPKTTIAISVPLTIELPYPGAEISKNHMFNSGQRRKGLTPTAQAWKDSLVEWLLRFPLYHMSSYISLPVTVEIGGRFTDERHRPDMHNLAELVCDAVQEGINIDDKYFEVVTKQPEMGVEVPVVIVTLRIKLEV